MLDAAGSSPRLDREHLRDSFASLLATMEIIHSPSIP